MTGTGTLTTGTGTVIMTSTAVQGGLRGLVFESWLLCCTNWLDSCDRKPILGLGKMLHQRCTVQVRHALIVSSMHCLCQACTAAVKHALFVSSMHFSCQACNVAVKHALSVSGMHCCCQACTGIRHAAKAGCLLVCNKPHAPFTTRMSHM